ncbi:MAG TPA: C4-type zinc ribbon domain-containing protein, partial [Candidatus Acidoferrales bacterium]
AQAKESHIQSLKDRKTFEMDVDQWKERLRKYKDQSYEVRSNEAYKALQHEIENAEKEIAKAEDRLLERMMAGEEFEKQVKAGEAELKKIEAAAEGERKQIAAEQAEVEKELAALDAEREECVRVVPEDLLDHYVRIAKRHAGIALAAVRDDACSACRVLIRPHVVQALRNPAMQEIIHCESCTRILYYVERQPPQESSQAAGQAGGNSGAGE